MPKGNKGLINHISNSTAALIAMNDEILFNAKQYLINKQVYSFKNQTYSNWQK